MFTPRSRGRQPLRRTHFPPLLLTALAALFPASPTRGEEETQRTDPVRTIDVHSHLFQGRDAARSFPEAAQAAIRAMDANGIARTILLVPPMAIDRPRSRYDAEELARVVLENPDRFSFLAGGGSLNPMIQEAVRDGAASEELRGRFEERALAILEAGALGFGEMAAEHFSHDETHPYMSALPDHPLFLLLAEIASRHGVPIDLHMEAMPDSMPLPPRLVSPPNPETIPANIEAFERLLAHDRGAKIVWAHAGSTVNSTPRLARELLERNSNLYMSLRIAPSSFERGPDVRERWVETISSFPDRFVVGIDMFYPPRDSRKPFPSADSGTLEFVRSLPAQLARRVAYENAVRIYRLEESRAEDSAAPEGIDGALRAFIGFASRETERHRRTVFLLERFPAVGEIPTSWTRLEIDLDFVADGIPFALEVEFVRRAASWSVTDAGISLIRDRPESPFVGTPRDPRVDMDEILEAWVPAIRGPEFEERSGPDLREVYLQEAGADAPDFPSFAASWAPLDRVRIAGRGEGARVVADFVEEPDGWRVKRLRFGR